MAEHHLPLPFIMGSDPRHYLSVEAGFALLGARRERLHPGSVPSFARHAIAAARAAAKREFLANHGS